MKLTDNDFTSHACDDPNKDGDGLGWNLDTDLTTEGKNELIQNQKLRELIEKFVNEKYTQLGAYGLCVDEVRQLLEEMELITA